MACLIEDFHGQKLSEYLYYYIIIICGAIGWIAGYFKESFLLTFYGWCVGVVLSLIICCPDWPMFNRHPVEWLKEIPRPRSKPSSENLAMGKGKKA